MKIYIRYLTSILVAIAAFLPETVKAQIQAVGTPPQPTATGTQNDALAAMDSVEISLLTCSPGEQIWSLYGHTAIRFVDKLHQTDLAINYGLFDYSQKYFYLRFTFGRTDYQMGIEPMDLFLEEYTDSGRGVIQQTLNLSREEKMAIAQALSENYTPINRVYRYNYFYDNCTTRARDIITNHLNGKVEYVVNAKVSPTWRQLVHQWNDGHPWMKFGCDLLLGVGADRKTDFAQQQFIPDTLRKDFDKALVVEPSGHKHKLVASTDYILRPDPSRVKASKKYLGYSDTACILCAAACHHTRHLSYRLQTQENDMAVRYCLADTKWFGRHHSLCNDFFLPSYRKGQPTDSTAQPTVTVLCLQRHTQLHEDTLQ